jgi:hypothetical protein
MFGNLKRVKAQSAMEYLMTYGWAILIIAVVLGVLFSLGIFNGNNLLPSACTAYQGYYCTSPVMTYNVNNYAQLTVTLGQATGSSWASPVVFYCGNQTSTIAATGAGFSGTQTVGSLGNNIAAAPISLSGSFTSGQTETVTMTCAGVGAVGVSPTVGTAVSGYIWAVYPQSGANVVTRVAAISIKVS